MLPVPSRVGGILRLAPDNNAAVDYVFVACPTNSSVSAAVMAESAYRSSAW